MAGGYGESEMTFVEGLKRASDPIGTRKQEDENHKKMMKKKKKKKKIVINLRGKVVVSL